MASKLRKSKTQYTQATVQHKIQNILYEAEQGMYNNPIPSLYSGNDEGSAIVHAPDVTSDETHITEL